MIARYDIGDGPRWPATLDEDGAWCHWRDVRTHVDIAISRLVQEDVVGCMAALRKIVDREAD